MTPPADSERDGTLTRLDGRDAVRFERRLPHPPERVWLAITDPADIEAWFPADIEGDLSTPGAALRFPFREDEGPTEDGEVLESEEPRVLAFTWGDQVLRCELEPEGDGTLFVFTHVLPREEAAKTAAGWQVCFEGLEARLAGGSKAAFDEDHWTELHEGYAKDFDVDPQPGREEIRALKGAGKLGMSED
jgi:uncharacterized protein YndB with AHSA1/START domain